MESLSMHSLLSKFGNCSNIMLFYGDIIDWIKLLTNLCRSAKAWFDNNLVAFSILYKKYK